jgi:SAM-dependent methyltransferase
VNPDVHRVAAEGFEREADAYDRGRPDYPSEVVAFLSAVLPLEPGVTVVDLAAGTGKLTRLLVPTGADVMAIEPVPAMRTILERALPTISVRDGTAEHTGIEAGGVDAVVAAQAFHWFDGSRAVAELARVIRPGGRLGIVFNVRDESDPLQAALGRIWAPHRGETPTHRGGDWRSAFDEDGPFSPLARRTFAFVQRLTPAALVDRAVSVSFIAVLAAPERQAVAEQVSELVRGRKELTLRYRTEVFWTERLSGRRGSSPASGASSRG